MRLLDSRNHVVLAILRSTSAPEGKEKKVCGAVGYPQAVLQQLRGPTVREVSPQVDAQTALWGEPPSETV
jgi:hypothetical protein